MTESRTHLTTAEIILLNVRWYCRYSLNLRNLKEMMTERGVNVEHSTINRWVLKYAPEPYLAATDALKADETIEEETELRQNKYLTNVIEQDHRHIKRIVKPMMELKMLNGARRT